MVYIRETWLQRLKRLTHRRRITAISCPHCGEMVEVPKVRAYALADNQTAILADWDEQILKDSLYELDAEGWDITELGFDELTPPSVLNGDPDDIPDLLEVPKAKLGDVFALGEHRVMCGDATSAGEVGLLVEGTPVDLMFADPPYGVSYGDKNEFLNAIDEGNRIQTDIAGDHQTPAEMSAFWRKAFGSVRAWLAPGASYYVTGPQGGDLLLLLLLALSESAFPLRHMLIWSKNNFVLGRSDYNYQHEPIIYGWVKGSHKFYGPSNEASIWNINEPHSAKLHPTMKPVELVARCITNSTKAGATVLDPFGGSGSTLIACEQTGRKCRMMEIDPRYVDVIVKRWENLTGKKAVLESAESKETESGD